MKKWQEYPTLNVVHTEQSPELKLIDTPYRVTLAFGVHQYEHHTVQAAFGAGKDTQVFPPSWTTRKDAEEGTYRKYSGRAELWYPQLQGRMSGRPCKGFI